LADKDNPLNVVLLAEETDPSVRDVAETLSISVDMLYQLRRQLRKNGEIETQGGIELTPVNGKISRDSVQCPLEG
jgi:DNA-binding IscR family transcriptional regulator